MPRTIWPRGVAVGALAAVLLTGAAATPGSGDQAAPGGRHSYSGTINGAEFRVEVPERWNGTLLLFSHGYFLPGFPPPAVFLTNATASEAWLLDHGYALAGSKYAGEGTGFAVEQAITDQIGVLDWFGEHVGRPRRTVLTGQSMGALISILLAERYPDRFAGVAAICGEYDANASWNTALDIAFTLRTLLAPAEPIDLVRAADPNGSTQALLRAVERARETRQGRARLALTAALGNVTGWYTAHQPQPTGMVDRIRQQSEWIYWAYTMGLGPNGRVDLEQRAGGNPSGNVGVDYRRQLARSTQTDLVRQAYRAAGLDLDADLDRLAAAPRIAADPPARAYLERYGVPRGTAPMPVVTLHTTGDSGAVPDQVRWYAEQVRRSGGASRLRQLYVARGQHCALSAAEEIVTLDTLLDRLDTGRWPETSPRRLNEAADRFPAPYHDVLDLGNFQEAPMPQAFTPYHPPAPLRPSR